MAEWFAVGEVGMLRPGVVVGGAVELLASTGRSALTEAGRSAIDW
jgi:hypothetical protein